MDRLCWWEMAGDGGMSKTSMSDWFAIQCACDDVPDQSPSQERRNLSEIWPILIFFGLVRA